MKLNDVIEIILNEIQQPLWEHWYIKEKLGSGAYSSVFKVEAKRSSRRTNLAALKIQPITANEREFVNEEDKRAYIERQKSRADMEADIMYSLRRFPNVVFYEDEDIHELIINGQFEGYYSLLRMELLTSVIDLIRSRKFDFSQQNIVKLACDIGRGIADAHSVGVIHRDIKPENFFVDDYGTYKIGDFNVAKRSDSARTMTGTPGYIAPEVYRAKSDVDVVYTNQADIYSFGICLYRLSNDMLYPLENTDDTESAHTRRYRGEKLPPPKNADPHLAAIILKACEFSTEDRYSEMGEVLRDLSSLSGSAVGVHSAPRASRVRTSDPAMTVLAEDTQSEQPDSISLSAKDAVGGSVVFGSYPEEPGGVKKPLRWRILSVEDGNALLITEKVIDAMSFADSQSGMLWQDSAVRRFLNNDFFNAAFNNNERQKILNSELMNYKNVAFRTNSGDKTTDKVYLLSVEEADRFFIDDSERTVIPTPLALSKGIFTSDDGKTWWWLRTSGCKEEYAADVDYGGDVDSYGSDRLYSAEGVRPVIRVPLSSIQGNSFAPTTPSLRMNSQLSEKTTYASFESYSPTGETSNSAYGGSFNNSYPSGSETISTNRNSFSSDSYSPSFNAPSLTISEGDTVKFGNYYADQSGAMAPIEWLVLRIENGKADLITKNCIDAGPFDSRYMNITWKQSELRKWLNSEFVQIAFGAKANSLETVECKNSPNPVFGFTGGMDTTDKVYLLSLEEVDRYFRDNDARIAKAMPFAMNKRLFIGKNGGVWWWLRSPGSNQQYSANVDYGGDIDYYGSDITSINAIRPAIRVDLSLLK